MTRAIRRASDTPYSEFERRRVRAGVPFFVAPKPPELVQRAPAVSAHPEGCVVSPHVGVLELRPKYRAEGVSVAAGEHVGDIIALGMRFAVKAPRSGVVVQLRAVCGQAVECGQPVAVIAAPLAA